MLTIYAYEVSQCCISNKETQKNIVEVSGYGVANGRMWEKERGA